MDEFVGELLKKLENSIWQYGLIGTDEIELDPALFDYCKRNVCGNYGTSWTCPPGGGTPEELKERILSYGKMLVFTTKHDLEDSFDFEGMTEAHKRHDRITKSIEPLCIENGAMLLSAGKCIICEKCTYPDAPCRFPNRKMYSLEACGINVASLSKAVNINYINGTNTVTYFTGVLFDKRK